MRQTGIKLVQLGPSGSNRSSRVWPTMSNRVLLSPNYRNRVEQHPARSNRVPRVQISQTGCNLFLQGQQRYNHPETHWAKSKQFWLPWFVMNDDTMKWILALIVTAQQQPQPNLAEPSTYDMFLFQRNLISKYKNKVVICWRLSH